MKTSDNIAMEIMQHTREQLVREGITNAMTYQEYRSLVASLVEQESTTGPEITEALINYTMLNHKRMKRLDKTLKISPEIQEKVKAFQGNVTWLVLTEGWCGDAAQTMPMMQKFAELNEGIDFKVLLRDENLELMDEFLYNGGRSIPKLIAFDTENGNIVNDWGPRPSGATRLVNDYKAAHGKLGPEFKEDLQIWYNKDKGQNTANDLLQLL